MTDKQRFILESVREVFFKSRSCIPDKETGESYFDENFEKQVRFFSEMYDKTLEQSEN